MVAGVGTSGDAAGVAVASGEGSTVGALSITGVSGGSTGVGSESVGTSIVAASSGAGTCDVSVTLSSGSGAFDCGESGSIDKL